MRITNSQVMRRYVDGLHQNFRRQSDSQNRVISQRKFTRASQNPMEAAKALRNRKAMREVETYKKNLETADGIYSAAEEAVRGVSGVLQTLQEKLIQAAHGTYNVPTDKQIIAQEIDKLAEQMVQLMNLVIADRRIFGGVNNSTQAYQIHGGPPGGTVLFNGVDVNLYSDHTMFPDSRNSFVDAGLGMKFLDEYTIDPQSAIAVTFNGAQILGSGMNERDPRTVTLPAFDFTPAVPTPPATSTTNTFAMTINGTLRNVIINNNYSVTPATHTITPAIDGISLMRNEDGTVKIFANTTGTSLSSTAPGLTASTRQETLPGGRYPNNIIQLTLDAAQSARAGTDDLTALYADLVFAAGSSLSLAIARIGSDQAFIEFNIERLTNNMFTLTQRENELEFVDIGEELITHKVLEMIYNATLQMSAQTIPMSIFNFIR